MDKCLLCGRNITDQKSVETGYGPVCYRKKFGITAAAGRKQAVRISSDIPCYDIPGQITIEEYLKTALGQ